MYHLNKVALLSKQLDSKTVDSERLLRDSEEDIRDLQSKVF